VVLGFLDLFEVSLPGVGGLGLVDAVGLITGSVRYPVHGLPSFVGFTSHNRAQSLVGSQTDCSVNALLQA
jgi:hypothetical protein